jgi:glycosyltransferase involved in cell wall biosynthesis
MLSILITHYNRPKALKVCLKSINDLDLSIPFEIIVCDDGSTKSNQKIIKNFKVTKLLYSEVNEGLTANLNKGIKACNGSFIFYCQEDAIILPEFKNVLQNLLGVLDARLLDMVRLTANYKFAHLIKVTNDVCKIPRFSFRNFNINTFQYSDHPFIVKADFYDRYGYYLEKTSGPYGETEYAIRLLNSAAKIGITNKKFTVWQKEVKSVMEIDNPVKKRKGIRFIWRFARALRQHLEWLLYNPNNRKLMTYKNKRK